jgi:hypothetical protein
MMTTKSQLSMTFEVLVKSAEMIIRAEVKAMMWRKVQAE